MTQEEKELLLRDLSARLSCGIIVTDNRHGNSVITEIDTISYTVYCPDFDEYVPIGKCSPYLRPMSSMTEKEKRELQSFYPGSFGGQWLDTEKGTIDISECSSTITLYLNDSERIVDWLNAHHFDYRGLIDRNLALEASEGMYNN